MELAHIRCGGACFCISRKSKMKKEQSQDYPFVITYLSNRYRLIECRDHIQWILQRRDKNVPRWRGIYYFLNTQSLSRIFRQFGLDDGVVGQLPERFESRFKTVQREQTKSDGVVPSHRQKSTRGQKFFWAAWWAKCEDRQVVSMKVLIAWSSLCILRWYDRKNSRRRLWVKL